MVDGDDAGDNYVTELIRATTPLSAIIQLPPGWTIEDVVCWMLEPGGTAALDALSSALAGFSFETLDCLRHLLKTKNCKDTSTIGLKEDLLAHDVVVGIMDTNDQCRERVVSFCEALVCTAIGVQHAHIVHDIPRSSAAARVFRFTP